jgi:hypothetical protein
MSHQSHPALLLLWHPLSSQALPVDFTLILPTDYGATWVSSQTLLLSLSSTSTHSLMWPYFFLLGTIIMFQSTDSHCTFWPSSFIPGTKTTLQSKCFSQLLTTHLRIYNVSTSQEIALLLTTNGSLTFSRYASQSICTLILPYFHLTCTLRAVCFHK